MGLGSVGLKQLLLLKDTLSQQHACKTSSPHNKKDVTYHFSLKHIFVKWGSDLPSQQLLLLWNSMPPPTKALNSCKINWVDVGLTVCLDFPDLLRAVGPGAARISCLGVPADASEIPDAIRFKLKSEESVGFVDNNRHRTGHMFLVKALNDFLDCNKLSLVIRAHKVKQSGFQVRRGADS